MSDYIEEKAESDYNKKKAKMDYIEKNYEKELAKVDGVILSLEDHGCLTLHIFLNYGGSVQGFGGYALDNWHKPWKRRRGTAGGLDYIIQILMLFGVNKLEDIKGRTVYALKPKGYQHGVWTSDRIKGLLLPEFDGGKAFLIEDWLKDWKYEMDGEKNESEER